MNDRINHVVIIGTGAVGCSYAYSMINQGVVEELILIDVNPEKAKGEVMDLNHGIPFAPSATTIRNGTYEDCAKAEMIVIAAGVPQKDKNEARLELLERNVRVFQGIVKKIMATSFNGIILVASNPVDVLSYVVYKESGLPANQVIGSGTVLDSARFKYLIGKYLEIDSRNVHAIIIGEHGDTELPVFSQASIGIENLDKVLERRNNPKDKENMQQIFEDVRNAAYEIINRKGATYYGIGMCLTRITKAILNNENSILPVSCLLQNQYGQNDLYMGVPAVVNRTGIKEVIELELNYEEQQLFKHSADVLKESIKSIQI